VCTLQAWGIVGTISSVIVMSDGEKLTKEEEEEETLKTIFEYS
jgi:hypothetical protein